MPRSRSENREKNDVEGSNTRGKRKVDESHEAPPSKRRKSSGSVSKSTASKAWKYIVPEKSWFPGKITTIPTKGVLTGFQTHLNEAQRIILRSTCFSHFLDCQEIVIQSQLIHYFLLRQVRQPNEKEMWFNISGRFVRFSLTEFCLVSGLRCYGSDDTSMLEKRRSRLKDRYFNTLEVVTHAEVRDAFLAAADMPDQDVSMLGLLYFITSYLYPRDYKKIVEDSLFALVEDFNAMNTFAWRKVLFDTLISSLREGLSKKSPHYRLRGLLTAFQAWTYETVPSVNGHVATRTSSSFPRIKNWTTNVHPSSAKLEGPECFSNPNIRICDLDPLDIEMEMPYMAEIEYIKPVQPVLSSVSKTNEDSVERTAHRAGTSRKPGSSGVIPSTPTLLLTDGSVGHSNDHVTDDDFVDPPFNFLFRGEG